MKHRYCDFCKKEIPSLENYHKLVECRWEGTKPAPNHSADMCLECFGRLRK